MIPRLLLAPVLCAALSAACTASRPVAEHALAAATPGPVATQRAAPAPHPRATAPLPRAAAGPRPVTGGDISWPNCPKGTRGALAKRPGKGEPMPAPAARFVVIGLTNGPGFFPNPCLAWEVAQARSRGLPMAAYAFTTLPNPAQIARYGRRGPWSATTSLGRLRNAAYAEARLATVSLQAVGLRPPIVWIDVEPQDYLEPWGSDLVVNRAVLRAVQRAYRDHGYLTGLYSSDIPWQRITGGLRDPGPTWVTVGPHGRAAALTKCSGPTFSGGPALLAQWWDDSSRDKDLLCPGVVLSRWFVR